MSKDILVFIEQRRGKVQSVSYELVGEARKLSKINGGKVVGLVVGDISDELVKEISEHGMDELVVASDSRLKHYSTLEYTEVVTKFMQERDFDIVLVGATSIGRDLAPRCSARIHTGLTADCTTLEIDEKTGNLLMTRPAFGGNIMATIVCEDHRPQMATVRPGVMKECHDKVDTVVTKFDISKITFDDRAVVKEFVEELKHKVDLTKEKVLVVGGRGVGSKENFSILESVAKALGGEVGATRAAVDDGYISADRQIGQTGVTVRPDLYIGCGVSGAIHHISGCEQSLYIIAINKDPDAPIFKVCDLGIVGDYKTILPQLERELLARK